MTTLALIWAKLVSLFDLTNRQDLRLKQLDNDNKALIVSMQIGFDSLLAKQEKTAQDVRQILNLLTEGVATKLVFNVTLNGHTTQGVSMFVLNDDQQVSISVSGADDRGNPVALPDGVVPAYSVSDDKILSLGTVQADGSIVVSAVGPLTAEGASVQVQASVDPGTGTPVTGVLDVQVVASALATIVITPGAATKIALA